MRKFFLLGGCLLVLLAVSGHEFWLQPSRFFASPGDKINLQVLVGEGFAGERSEGKKNRLIQYRHHATDRIRDLTPALSGETYGDVTAVLTTPGTHLFSFANTPKLLAMRADSFLLYLREEGLDNVIVARQQRGETNNDSRELYQRCVKTLVLVGTTPPLTDTLYARNTGMPLEIIPVQNPYRQRPGQWAEFRVLFRNRPLPNALVLYWNRSPDTPAGSPVPRVDQQRSDAQGRVRFRLKAGQNMVSLVCMEPSEKPTEADWHSYWGSMTFGCR